MLINSTEILELTAGTDYSLVFIQTGKRQAMAKLGGWQIGPAGSKIGLGNGPIVELDFVYFGTAAYIMIWTSGMDLASPGVFYPKDHFTNPQSTKLSGIWFTMFKFCDIVGAEVAPPGTYKVHGHRLASKPLTMP